MKPFRRAAATAAKKGVAALPLAILTIVWALSMPPSAAAQGAAAAPAGSGEEASAPPPLALPEPLTRENIRVLMSRLSDDDVRRLLMQQLDKAADAVPTPEVATLMDRFERALPTLKTRLTAMVAAVADLPSVFPFLIDWLTDGRASRIWLILFYTGIILGGGFAGEWLFRRLFTRNIVHPQAEKTSGIHKACVLGLRMIVDLLGIAVFGLCAFALFFVFYQGHEPVRLALGSVYWMIILIRLLGALARFVLAPGAPAQRYLPVGDTSAVKIYRRVMWISSSLIVAAMLLNLIDDFGMEEGLTLLLGQIVGLAVVVFLAWIIWHDRRAIAELIRPGSASGDEPSGPVKRLLAANWHILAICYLAGVYVFGTLQMLLTGERATTPAIISIVVLIAIPAVDWMMRAGLRRLLKAPAEPGANRDRVISETAADDAGAFPSPVESHVAEHQRNTSAYFDILVKNLRIVLAIVVAMALAEIWDLDLRGRAAAGVGETLANAVFDIAITLILASAIWGIVKTAISHRLPEPGTDDAGENESEAGGTGKTRLETLLPLFQKFLFVTLIVIVVMIILSELGVDIGPLIAGAGIVGVAIGFGAQTLVRDIVSGVFFLIEDAFRVGEYIQVGTGARGTVEDISIRSLRLRHHNGPIHTIPFGEIGTLTNYSRDWVIMKLEMRLPFETDIEKVRKIVKKVGQEMMADEELGKNFLQPVKSQGVNRMDDSAFIFRVKFMAKPGEQFVLRREVYRRVQEALAKQGIHFAPKRVIVDAAGMSPEQAAAAAAADETPASGVETAR